MGNDMQEIPNEVILKRLYGLEDLIKKTLDEVRTNRIHTLQILHKFAPEPPPGTVYYKSNKKRED